MRPSLTLAALLIITAGVSAQRRWQMWDNTTEFTSRGNIGTAAGHLSQAHAFGEVAGITDLNYLQYVMQDQDQVTREAWDMGLSGTGTDGFPDHAGMSKFATNLLLPPNATGIGAWLITHTALATTPIQVPANGSKWSLTWHIKTTAPQWTMDGLSTHMSQGAPYNSTILCHTGSRHREIPRTEGSPARQIIEKHNFGENPTQIRALDRTWRQVMGSTSTICRFMSSNQVYNAPCSLAPINRGYASIDPDFNDAGSGPAGGRYDDLHWRIEADGTKFGGGIAVLLSSTSVLPVGLPLFDGTAFLNPTDPLFGLVLNTTLNASGIGTIDVPLGPGTSPLRPIVESLAAWHSQAVVAKPPEVGISNLTTMRPSLGTAGYTAAQVSLAASVTVPRVPAETIFQIRNDGPDVLKAVNDNDNGGTLVVQQLIGSNPFGQPVTVNELTQQNILIGPPVTNIRITTTTTVAAKGTNSGVVNFVYRKL